MGALAERLRESRAALGEVWRNDALRRVDAALAGSVIGDWAYAVAVSVFAYRAGGATAVGVFGVVRYVSMSVASPFAATLADRFDRRRIMVVADLARAVLVVAATAVVAVDGPDLAVFALALLVSLGGTAFRPAQASLLPHLATHPGQLTAANVVASTVESLGFFAGPAVAGLLLAVTGIEVVFLFDALTFVWSAALVARVRPPEGVELVAAEPNGTEEDVEAGPGGILAEAGAGFRVIAGHRDLRLLVAVYCGQTVVAGASLVFTVAVAIELLDLGEGGVGLLDASLGVGGLAGGFLALALAQRGRLAVDFGFGVLLWSAPLLLVAAVPEIGPTLFAMGMVGLGNSLVDINAYTIIQRLAPDEVLGRVFGALESALIAGMAAGALLMPLLIETIGLRAGIGAVGAAVLALTVAAGPGLRRIDLVALAPDGIELLRGVPFLAPLPDRTLERLARVSTTVTVAAGEAVFHEGDAGDRFYVVEAGDAEVTAGGAHLRAIWPGGSFGEIALLRDIPRTATVTAGTELRLRAVDRQHFLAAVTGHGEARRRADRSVTGLLADT